MEGCFPALFADPAQTWLPATVFALQWQHQRTMAMKRATQGAHKHPTHAPIAVKGCYKDTSQEEGSMRTRKRDSRQLVPTMALLALIMAVSCIRHASGGGVTLSSITTIHKLRGMESLPDFTNDEPVNVIDEMCDGRARNLTWGHDDEWYSQCHEDWQRVDSQVPTGHWTQTEFTNFVQLQAHAPFKEFKQLPLPLTMIFNELSCRCLEHETSDCCHGPNAKISPGDNVLSWMDSICNRVDNALDEVCRRQQQRARGSEL